MNKFRNPAKWKPDGPARSNSGFSIKKESISAPIPQIEDDEFPIRTPGASIATPLGRASMDQQTRFPEPPVPPAPVQNGTIEATVPLDSVRTNKTHSTEAEITKEAPVPQPVQPIVSRTSIGSVRSRTSIRRPERKKSTLRSVLGKLFGKKRKSNVSPTRKRDSRELRAPQHRSDPTALNRAPIAKINSQQRSASLPIDEYNRALRSHSVVLEDFPLRDSYQQDAAPVRVEGRPRGATIPSRTWEHGRLPGYMDWTGLTPRPVSSHARGSKTDSDIEAREVGVALTSGSKAENRKSRSVGDLRESMSNTLTRRRSDEIRYWRESYDQGGVLSPLSSIKPDVEEEPLVVVEPAESDKENYEPPQPFNFGPIGEMAGMKITQAASLETRVMQMEQRMHQMERVVSRIAYPPVSEVMQFQDTERRSLRPTTGDSELSLPVAKIHRGSPQYPSRQGLGSQFHSSSYGSSRPSTTNTNNNNSAEVSFENPPSMFSTFHTNAPRPLSTSTTIRNNPLSSSPTTKDGALTAEHYAALQTLIQHEQSTRQTLEDLVQNLQQEVIDLRNSIAHHPAFATFENDDSDSEDERGFTESFHTPSQEPPRGFGDEIFGNVSGNRGVGYVRGGGQYLNHKKSTSRTMSLSQLTQNGVQQRQVGTVV